MLADRVLAREHARGEHLAENDHVHMHVSIVVLERAPATDRDAERREVSGRDCAPRDRAARPVGELRAPLHVDRAVDCRPEEAVRGWQRVRNRNLLDTRDPAKTLFHRVEERDPPGWVAIGRAAERHRCRDRSFYLHSERLALKVPQRFQQQTRARKEDERPTDLRRDKDLPQPVSAAGDGAPAAKRLDARPCRAPERARTEVRRAGTRRP